ncbi:hypothetical protein, partial [Mycolicibacterium flavescens]|uniref:hypothetical protein n=1 Tax=Mycolicibacterium flavescens TaxID=1776 RepID=UPI0021F28DF4
LPRPPMLRNNHQPPRAGGQFSPAARGSSFSRRRQEGLISSSAILSERAGQLAAVSDAHPTGEKASTRGATAVFAALTRFSQAYAGRLAERGQSATAAAAGYDTADNDAAANIGDVPT